MKASGRENSSMVESTDKVQRIARVYHYGLKDRPKPRVHVLTYAERQLLGLYKNVT